jgi:folate-dependent phosphoribosylglycinamide formyltransferase PurN
MRTVLICHADDPLNAEGLARWLASFTDLAGRVILHDPRQRLWRRLKNEYRRVGALRLFDVFAFRLYYKLFLQRRDRVWEQRKLAELCAAYPPLPATSRVLHASSPNTREVEEFLHELAPTLTLARCKTLLKPAVFTIPTHGTFVMHPGICPEYRNSHGCFWALARNDLERVGMTLLRIDRGVDTGPVHGYYRCHYDENVDSHIVIQHRVVFDNLDLLAEKLSALAEGRSQPLETTGRESGVWGQPWLTAYWMWQRQAKRRRLWQSRSSITMSSSRAATMPAASQVPERPVTS